MGISFGSASKKPYVGSKEVQEAYVGSQLVYKNRPSDNWVYIGEANKYYLAGYASLIGGTFTKEENKFRIALNNGNQKLSINEMHGNTLKFISKFSNNYTNGGYVYLYAGDIRVNSIAITNAGNKGFQLNSVSVPSNITKIEILGSPPDVAQGIVYADEIRFE